MQRAILIAFLMISVVFTVGCSTHQQMVDDDRLPFIREGENYNIRLAEETNVLQMTVVEIADDGWVRMRWHGPRTERHGHMPDEMWINLDQVIWMSDY